MIIHPKFKEVLDNQGIGVRFRYIKGTDGIIRFTKAVLFKKDNKDYPIAEGVAICSFKDADFSNKKQGAKAALKKAWLAYRHHVSKHEGIYTPISPRLAKWVAEDADMLQDVEWVVNNDINLCIRTGWKA